MTLDSIGTRFISLNAYLSAVLHHRDSLFSGQRVPLGDILAVIQHLEPDYYWAICSGDTYLSAVYDCSSALQHSSLQTMGFVYQDSIFLGRYEYRSKPTVDSIMVHLPGFADPDVVSEFLHHNTQFRYRDSKTLQRTVSK